MSENNQFTINNLSDVQTEMELLNALMSFDTEETIMAMVKLRPSHFYDDGCKTLFEVLSSLESRGFPLKVETVRTELTNTSPALLDNLKRVVLVEPTPAVMFAVDSLGEWENKRELYRALSAQLGSLAEGDSAAVCASRLEDTTDALLISDDGDTPTFLELEKTFAELPPVGKISTLIPFLDVKGKMELGSLIGLLGDEDAGKTTVGLQICKNVTKQGFKVLVFPLEFKSRKIIDQNIRKHEDFRPDLFLIEDRSTDLDDIIVKIKIEARRGLKLAFIDSQMTIDVEGTFANEALKETQKFKKLQRLAIRLDIIIIFVCQRNNSHSASNVIAPYGSTHAKHFLHEIWFVKKNNLSFDSDGSEDKKGMREFMRTKTKIGGYFSKPMWLNPRTWEFQGVQYADDDPRSTKTVGSGRPKSVETVVYEMEDTSGNVSALEDPDLFKK